MNKMVYFLLLLKNGSTYYKRPHRPVENLIRSRYIKKSQVNETNGEAVITFTVCSGGKKVNACIYQRFQEYVFLSPKVSTSNKKRLKFVSMSRNVYDSSKRTKIMEMKKINEFLNKFQY